MNVISFFSFIFGIHYNGTLFFETEPMPGTSAGTPQATRDGRYLAITHNDDQLGYFSFFDTNDLLDANETLPLEPLLEYESTLLSFNETTPFSELGYFARPDEGYSGSHDNNGLNNDNDIFLWISDTNTNVLNVNGVPMAGEGQMYVFQLPKDYDHSGNGLEVIPIGPVRGYQAATRPILTNGGKSMYWSMVRGETRSWDGRLFSRSHNGRNNTQRGDPPYIGARAAPSLNSDSSRVFGPGPSNDVWSAGRNMEDFDSVSTDGIVSAQLLVTLDDQFVLWGTEKGQLTMASVFDLSQQAWQIGDFSDIPFDSIQGEMARDSSGTMIFVTTTFDNIAGTIIALRIANEAEPPSSSPSSYPSSTPSLRPSVAPSSSSQEPTFIEFLELPTDPPVGSEATVGPTAQAPMTNPSNSDNGSSSSTIKNLSLWSYIGIVVAIAFVFLG